MLIRHPKSEKSRKPGLAEDVKETLIASGIGDRQQFRVVYSDKGPKVRIASRISIFEQKFGHVPAAGR